MSPRHLGNLVWARMATPGKMNANRVRRSNVRVALLISVGMVSPSISGRRETNGSVDLVQVKV